jgi:hypothetical protein
VERKPIFSPKKVFIFNIVRYKKYYDFSNRQTKHVKILLSQHATAQSSKQNDSWERKIIG